MAKLVNVNPGMTMIEAQQVGARNSWLGAGALYFDPIEDEPTDMEPIESGSSALTEPQIAGSVARWSKDGMMNQIRRGTMTGPLRDTRSRYGDPKEWDHISFTFSRDESARLAELGEGVQERLRMVIAAALRRHPGAPDMTRQMILSKLHDSSGNFHFHALLHRHAVKAPAQGGPLEASASIDMMRSSEVQTVAQAINQALTNAELGEFQIREATVGDNDVFAERSAKSSTPVFNGQNAEPEARDDAVGADPGQSIYEQARSLTPSEATLKRMVELQNKKVSDAQKALEEATRMQEGFQNLLAAEAQKNDALRAQQLAEDRAEIAAAAQAEAEQQAAQAREAERVALENAAHSQKLAEDARKDADAAEADRAATEERLVTANTQIGELEDKVEAQKHDLEERDEKIDELTAEVEKIPELTMALSTAEEQIEQKDKVIAKRDEEITGLKSTITGLEKTISDQKAEHEQSLKTFNAEWEQKLKDAADKAFQEGLAKSHAEFERDKRDIELSHKAELSEQKALYMERIATIEVNHGKEQGRLQKIIDSLRAEVSDLKGRLADVVDHAKYAVSALTGNLMGVFEYRHSAKLSTKEADMEELQEIVRSGIPDFTDAQPSSSHSVLSDDDTSNDDDGYEGPGQP